jgi:hypothetical protein
MRLIPLLLLLLLPFQQFAQDTTSTTPDQLDSVLKDAPRVFVDCFYCDLEYIKQNVPFLNYVRDRKVADVHVLGLRQRTGAGGWEESFEFIGQLRFAHMNDTLKTIIGPNDSSDEKRVSETNIIKLGILRYVAKTSLAQNFDIGFTKPITQTNVIDPWKNWVFEISGRGSINGSDVSTNTSYYGSIEAEKVTPEFRFSLDLSSDYYETKQILTDGEFKSTLKGHDFRNDAVWSISDHWSTGTFVGARTSVYNNYAFTYDGRVGIEYNVFPYAVSAKKQLRISYRAGAGENYYNDTTIFDKTRETIYRHGLSASYRVREKWGNANVAIWTNHYLNNTELYSFNAWASLNLRIAKGFNFNISGNFGLIRDQISLSKAGLTDAEILAGQGQRATSYTYRGNVGLSYTFGSIFNSVVNPRFG